MSPRNQFCYSIVATLVFLPISSVYACDPAFDDNCNDFTFSHGAAIGIAIAVFAIIILLASLMKMRQRKRAQQANLAFIRNAQAQQGDYYAGPTPSYPPNYGPGHSPSQTYSPAPQSYYPPPQGPPPGPPAQDVKSHGKPTYDPTDAPQFPPPTYSSV